MKRASPAIFLIAFSLLAAVPPAQAAKKRKPPSAAQAARPAPAKRVARDGEAEARLIAVYKLVGQARGREALAQAESLVKDHPNFQLAQLVYGDLLAARARPVRMLGDVPDTTAHAAAPLLAELREESQLRLKALRERPPAGAIPSQFLALSPRNKHAIAVDASRARLYLFENTDTGLKLIADYYVSVGKSGIEKSVEGDLRTPLGVYFVMSNLDPKSLKDFYGAGALPINYPNPYDMKRGKTGSGIWLHGTPPSQFARAPKATDGCVALTNPDLQRIIDTVEVRTTPVIIAPQLHWVPPQSTQAEGKTFENTLQAWRTTKASGDMSRLLSFYTPDFNSYGKTLAEWTPVLKGELDRTRGRDIVLKDLSYLRWTDSADTMVVTFGEVAEGARSGPTKRQYWVRQGSQWKIFFEGVIG
ncbi:L,D-transpeptidase family protein [Variovorax terrae]|uniref:L,D-transpeptidase family protein n=1 Tax=Variovorax terrae TaxID=2923278 RepID=A0A9X1VS72_9BURK|nr:L,D-transpeptidase family protein [Variovorax terrae]MCJ0762821.1 L,D-transpeptidase family protein [Variovorax terrae]